MGVGDVDGEEGLVAFSVGGSCSGWFLGAGCWQSRRGGQKVGEDVGDGRRVRRVGVGGAGGADGDGVWKEIRSGSIPAVAAASALQGGRVPGR